MESPAQGHQRVPGSLVGKQNMSSINSVNPQSPVQQIIANPVRKEIPAAAGTQAAGNSDRLELSGVSHLLQALKSNDVRADKVAAVRAQIDAGTYESDDKLSAAADKMLDDVLDK